MSNYKNKEDQKKYNKKYYMENKEILLKYRKKYNKENKEKYLEQRKKYHKEHREAEEQYSKEYYIKNKEKINEYNKSYYFINKEKILKSHKKNQNEYQIKRRKKDPKFNLDHRMKCAISNSLRKNKKSQSWQMLVGYTLKDLIKHLKKTIPKNYIWEDILNGKLHVDHIIPKSVFNYTKPEHIDFKRCWALSNLRLLPAKENIAKSNYLSKPFQPALQI